MSVAEMIFEKAKALPGKLQAEALDFVDYLTRKGDASKEAAAWKKLGTETRALPQVKTISEDETYESLRRRKNRRLVDGNGQRDKLRL